MSLNNASITDPVPNGGSLGTPIFELPDGVAGVVVTIDADQDLTLTLYQSYDNENFDAVNTYSYSTGSSATTVIERRGVYAYFVLANSSGSDCTYTRAFGDYVNSTSTISGTITTTNPNLDIPLSTVNTSLVDLANLDVPLSSATSTLNNTLTGINSNLTTATISVKQAADSNIIVYGSNLASPSQYLPVGVNEYGCLCTVSNCVTASLPDGYTNTQSVERSCSGGYISKASMGYMYNGSTWDRVRGSASLGLQTYSANVDIPLSSGLSAVTTAVNNVDTATQNVDSNVQVIAAKVEALDANLAIYNARQSSVYSNSITQIGQILVASPVSGGRVLSINAATASANQTAIGLYDTGAIAPTEANTPFHTIYLDNTTTSITHNFGPGGIAFNNGIGVRAQTVSGQFTLVGSNSSVAADTVVMSITYTTE